MLSKRLSLCCLTFLAGCARDAVESRKGDATRKESSAPEAAGKPEPRSLEERIAATAWRGDLDEMVKRRFVRVIVPFSRPEFFYREGKPAGFLHEAFREFEGILNHRFHTDASNRVTVVLIPTARSKIRERMIGGFADMAAGSISITEERKADVDFSIPTYPDAKALIVTGPASPALGSMNDLSGEEVWVHPYTRFAADIDALNTQLQARGMPPVRVRLADSNLELEDLLEMVNAGLYGMTVVQSQMGKFCAKIFDKIRVRQDLVISPKVDLAWVIPKNCPKLESFVNEFVGGHRRGTEFGNMMIRRYLQGAKYVTNATSSEGLKRFDAVAGLFRKYGSKYQLDPYLLLAQGYQESRLDPSARSGAGAVGIMQIKPSTAAGPPVSIKDVQTVENNIHAGARFMHFLIREYFDDPQIDHINRGLFAFAAYNAGPARIARLRTQAAEAGYDPNRWFGNVEVVVAREVGMETTQYVANIYKYYLAYKLADESRSRVKGFPDRVLP